MSPGHTFRFLRGFLRNPSTVGAVTPSSRYLARAMLEDVRLPQGSRIVEFGPGTGSFTEAIQRILHASSAYLGIERDEQFVRILRGRFPKLRFHCGLAQHAESILAANGGGPVKVILSGLPFAAFPDDVQDVVINAISTILEPGGLFRTFQYVHAFPLAPARRFRHRMDRIFGVHRRSKAVLRNVPPAFVLSWRLPGAPQGHDERKPKLAKERS